MAEKIGFSHADFPLLSDRLCKCFLLFATVKKSHVGEICPVDGNDHCHLWCYVESCVINNLGNETRVTLMRLHDCPLA